MSSPYLHTEPTQKRTLNLGESTRNLNFQTLQKTQSNSNKDMKHLKTKSDKIISLRLK